MNVRAPRSARLGAGLRSQGNVLCLLYFLYYCSLVSWTPFFSVYLRQVGLSGLQVGTLSGVGLAVMLVSQPFWGLMADLRGRRRALLVTMLLAAFLLAGFAWPAGFPFFLVWTIVHGFPSKAVGPLLDSLVLDYVEERRHLTFGRLRVWGAVAWAVGAMTVGSAIAGRDIRLVFAFGAIFMLLAWVVAWRSTRERRDRATLGRGLRGAGTLLRSRPLITFLVLAMLLYLATAPIWSFYPIYMTELGATPQVIGLAFALRGLAELPFYLAASAIIRRFTCERTVVFAILAFVGRALLYSAIRAPALAAAVEATHGLTFSLFLVASIEYINRRVPREWRATGQTLLGAAYYGAGGIVGNTWAGYLYDRVGVQAMFRVNGLLLLGVAVIAGLLLRPGSRGGTDVRQGNTGVERPVETLVRSAERPGRAAD